MRKILALVLLTLATTGGVLAGVERGNRLFRAGRYAEAVAEYRTALQAGEDTPMLRYNLGTALLELGRYEEAQEHLEAALDAVDPTLRQYAHYNLGQRYLEEARAAAGGGGQTSGQLYDAAVEAYRQALRLRPGDEDAKWNYELALREREQQSQQAGGQSQDRGQQTDQQGQEGREGSRGPGQGGSAEEEQPPDRGMTGQAPLTPEQAERILSGVEQDERELFRNKLRQGRQQTRVLRDW